MKHNNFVYFCISSLITIAGVASCNNDDEPNESWKDSTLCKQLVNTNWQLYSIVDYWGDEKEVDRSDRVRPQVFTFTSEPCPDFPKRYLMYEYNTIIDEIKSGPWYIDGDFIYTGAGMVGPFGTIVKLTSSEFEVRYDYADNDEEAQQYGCDYGIEYYSRVYKTLFNISS